MVITRAQLILVIALGVSWASAFPMVQIAVREIEPLTITAARIMIAAVVLWGYKYWQDKTWRINWQYWPAYCVLALLGNNIPFTLINYGQQVVSSAEAALLIAIVPIGNLLLAHFLLEDEKLTVRKCVASAFGFMGVVVLVWPKLNGGSVGSLWAYFGIMIAAFCYAATHVYGRYVRHIPITDRAVGMLLVSTFLALPMAFFVDGAGLYMPQASMHAILATVGLGLIPSALAAILFFTCLQKGNTFLTGFASYLTPVFGVIFGWLFLQEVITVYVFLALLCMMIGMLLARGKKKDLILEK